MYPFIVTKRSSSSFSPLTASHQISSSLFLLESFFAALRTVPLPLGSITEVHAGVVEPLYRTAGVVAANHVTVRDLAVERSDRLINKLTDRQTD